MGKDRLRACTGKGKCDFCGNSSTHAKTCPWAYVPEPWSKARYKQRRLSLLIKLKSIIKIIKA